MKYETAKMEIFKPVEGFEDYLVSDEGRIYSLKTKKFRKPTKTSKGYLQVNLSKSGKVKRFLVHRLVAEAFIPNPLNLDTVDHINNIKTDNRVENLQWLSREDNVRKACNKKVFCLELNKVFDSTRAAERELGLWHQSISKCCLGKQKTHGDYHFEFYNEEGD